MSINAIENLGSPNAAQSSSNAQQDAIRRAAAQFEAILLMQLTSALNGANNNDEESLFGGDGGSNLAKQMFSEQLASTMADSGGIGLSDLIMRQFGLDSSKAAATINKFSNVISAVKDIKSNTASKVSINKNSSLSNKYGESQPVTDTFLGDPNDAMVISTFEDRFKDSGVDSSMPKQDSDVNLTNAPNKGFNLDKEFKADSISYAAESKINTKTSGGKLNYQMPVAGRISSAFGSRFHPIDKTVKFHAGMDIAAPTGTPINAASDGVVAFAGWSKGYGNLVIVRHSDGKETRYGHTSKMFVKEGDSVVAGQPIAAVGSTGKSTGPHLHFEVRENGQAVDPRKFLSNVLPKNADK